MSHRRHLPFWKATMSLAVHLEQAVNRYARDHKYTLGQDLHRSAHRLYVWVAQANDASGFKRRTLLAWWTPSAKAAA
jgi:hypothetical protein